MNRLKTGLALVGLCTLTVIAAEFGARAALWGGDLAGFGQTELKARHAAFEGLEYDPDALFRELEASREPAYAPYTLWRHRPFRGEFINVDEEGLRITVYGSDDPDALRVWVLGGSTVFGYGVPDAETVPSHIARLLGHAGVEASVLNLGEDAYVSMQETIRLAYQLHRRQPPDLVIVHSGFNDSNSAWAYPRLPAIHVTLAHYRERFERPLLAGLRRSALYEVAMYARYALLPRPPARPMSEAYAREAGRWTADNWIRNMRSIEALGQAHGFDTLIVFQPTVDLGDKPLHPSERRSQLRSGLQEAMHERVLELASRPEAPTVLDLTGVFDEVSEPLFFDAVHLTGRGNELVAAAWLDALCSAGVDRIASTRCEPSPPN